MLFRADLVMLLMRGCSGCWLVNVVVGVQIVCDNSDGVMEFIWIIPCGGVVQF